jgi:hypothetical protein
VGPTPQADWEIRLLPALPAAWGKGSASGLRARGGLRVDLAWSGGVLREVTLTAERPVTVAVAWPEGLPLRTPAGPAKGQALVTLGAGGAWRASGG